ncbi:MAG: hypothetical protein NTW19_08175 [Planctomycetota bacterium]|nr:hypothetical protein [Planctomycetota bacterium]
MTIYRSWVLSTVQLGCVIVLALGHQAFAAVQDLTIKDYTCRGFAPDLVQYRVENLDARKGRNLRLFDAEGKSLPVQWEADVSGKGGVVSFVTAVAHDEAVTHHLEDTGRGPAPQGQLTVTTTKEKTVLANGLLSVTMPAAADRTYDTPTKAGSLPAPILSFTSGSSGPMGAGKLLADRPVKRMRVWLVAQGPVYADAWYELTWADGGFYRCRVRVIDGVPLAQVMEEYDLGKLDGSDFWELALTQGWQPDQVEQASPWGNGTGVDFGKIDTMASFNGQEFRRMSVDNGLLGHLGFFRKEQRESDPSGYPMAGIVTLLKGEWRRVNVLEVHVVSPGDVRVRFPMSVRNASWPRDSISVSSPFSSHSFDPDLPPTYGRRHWGLMLSQVRLPKEEGAAAFFGPGYQGFVEHPFKRLPPFSRARSLYGIVALDQYKDYILDWPEGNVKYPRLSKAGSPSAVATDPKERDQQLKRLYDLYLRWIPNHFMTCPTSTHHGTADNYVGAWLADAFLSSQSLTAEQRKDIRARLALIMYLHHEPAVLSYGIGSHPGNPNMPLARFFPGVAFLGLLPDHPMYAKWVDFMSRQSENDLGKSTAPGGAWVEYGTYHFHGFRALPMLASIAAAQPPNTNRIFDYVHADLDYITNLLSPPDPRYRARIIPGLANSGPNTTSRLVEGANAFQDKDPEFAARLLWAWKENNSKPGALPAPEGIQPKSSELTSRYFPGFGVVFRAHQGPQETWMMLRNGFLWSHWNVDPGHFTMASRGAMLVPYQPFQYGRSSDSTFDLCNTVRFGAPQHQMPYGWPDSNVLDYSFGSSVDYAWSSTGVPDWFINPGVSEAFQKELASAYMKQLATEYQQREGAFQWDRQVLFMKGKSPTSPNYFVFRDSTRGDGKLASYLNLNLLGDKSNLHVAGARMTLDTEWPIKLDVLFAHPSAPEPAMSEQKEPFQFAETNTPGSLPKGETPSRNWLSAAGTPWKSGEGLPASEKHLVLRIPAAPDQGHFWVLYPRDEKEAPPTVKRLAEGVLSITHREGTDFVMLSSLPLKFEGEGVQFEGCAGAVRLTTDEVAMTLTGGGGRVGYKGKVLEGAAPFEKRFPIASLSAGVEKQAAPPSKVVLPAWEGGDELAPGLRKKAEGDMIRYRVQADQPVLAKTQAVQVEGCNALIEVTVDRIRFVVPDRQYARLSVGGVGVRGMGPFDLTFTPTGIKGTVDGKLRTLVTTWPAKVTRPMFCIDGRRWYAGWADDPTISNTPDRPQFSLAFGVLDGPQTVEIGETQFMPMPPRPAVARAGF